jgi:hypothetical protein
MKSTAARERFRQGIGRRTGEFTIRFTDIKTPDETDAVVL